MSRLIDADALKQSATGGVTSVGLLTIADIDNAPTVDAVPVVHGDWRVFIHSALVRWKDGEPVWADRNVYRCSRCDFGTIAKHNYCPRCGATMDGCIEDGWRY